MVYRLPPSLPGAGQTPQHFLILMSFIIDKCYFNSHLFYKLKSLKDLQEGDGRKEYKGN